MNNYQGQLPNTVHPQVKSNRVLWIILGSVIFLLVIAIGGCMACGALIGLSNLASSSDSDPGSTNNAQSTSRQSNGSSAPGTLGGTAWKGNLNCDDGDNVPVVFRFAESGAPIYEYQTSTGPREVDLTSSGQIVRFVPRGGGVTTVRVDSLSAASDRMTHTLSISHEGGSGGTLEQSQVSVTTDISLSGADLIVETKVRSQSTISQPGIVVPGDERVVTCSGNLRRE